MLYRSGTVLWKIVGCLVVALPALASGWSSPPATAGAGLFPRLEDWSAEGDQTNAWFGCCVATAGDVNGDGYSDVIVGARRWDAPGLIDAGQARLYLGSPAGVQADAAWTAHGDREGANFGTSVASAGDVNGDGYDDVIIGSVTYANGQADEGCASLYLGSPSGLEPEPRWIREGNADFAYFGVSVATAGDVDDDGYDDVVVGADGLADGAGGAYLYRGCPAGLDTLPAWEWLGAVSQDFLGCSVGTAGDVDADGYSDVFAAACGCDGGMGRVYVFRGSPSGLSASPDWTIAGDQAGSYFGFSAATAGDVNGDGFSEVIVGGFSYDGSGGALAETGVACVFHLSQTGVEEIWRREGEYFGEWLGNSVAPAGDLNGDGYADVLIGSFPMFAGEEAGHFLAFLGSASGLLETPVLDIEGTQPAEYFGRSVATAGDVDGDGFNDIIAGAPEYSGDQQTEGRAVVFLSASPGVFTGRYWADLAGGEGDRLGAAVSPAGDLNGDGYGDFVAGAEGAEEADRGRSDEGEVRVYYGSAADPIAGPVLQGDLALSGFGESAAGAGDVNGDGYDDVLVGAPTRGAGIRGEEGATYLFYGSASGVSPVPGWTFIGVQAGARSGWSVAGAGDVNRDGYADILIGTPFYDASFTDEGRAALFLGSSSGPGATPVWSGTGEQAGAWFGHSVAAAGDVNRDGFGDVLIGAPGQDAGQEDEGRACLYYGSGSAPYLDLGWTADGDRAGGMFGRSVASAGDYNGDGFADLVIGAPFRGFGRGRISVYPGSPSGPGTDPWTADGSEEGAAFGERVGSAGDVNGDGSSDIIASEPFHGEYDVGMVRIYHGTADGPLLATQIPGEITFGEFGRGASTAGDVNGDGFSDILVGEPAVSPGGEVRLYKGNTWDGLERRPRQGRPYSTSWEPLALLNRTDSQDIFRLRAVGRTPLGRGQVRLEWEVGLLGELLDGDAVRLGSFMLTSPPGSPGGSAADLVEFANLGVVGVNDAHWRLRIASRSPFFPHTPWFSLQGNGPQEKDLLMTPPDPGSIADDPSLTAKRPRIESILPNPFSGEVRLACLLPRPGPLRLEICEAAGRTVRILADGVYAAGRHEFLWDGHDRAGRERAAGVYFARLTADGMKTGGKVIRIRH